MLISCPKCGKTVSDKAQKCLHCGFSFNKKFEIIPEEAEAVRKAFELGIKQVPYLRICRVIGGMLGKDVFHRATLNNMLRRPEYAGFQYNSAGELMESKSFSGIAIISFSQFLKMQERMALCVQELMEN